MLVLFLLIMLLIMPPAIDTADNAVVVAGPLDQLLLLISCCVNDALNAFVVLILSYRSLDVE